MIAIANAISIGLNRLGGIFSAYAARVTADGGVTEAGACVDAVSTLLKTASLLLVPSGYKSGKVYSEIPTNGNGDLTWTRASTAVRTNSTGLLETMATGVPRLSYMYGSCPALLLEPQRTTLFQNTGWAGGGAIPTGWTSFISGSTTALTSIKNLSVTAYRFSGTSQRTFFVNSISVTSGTTYTISFYVESVTTAAEIQQCVAFGSSTSSTYYKNGVAITSTTSVEAGNLYSVTWVAGATTTADMRIGIGTQSNVTANLVISMPQMEQGAYPTTFILSPVGATATRVADSFTRNNIYTNGLISASGGTWYVELRNNVAYTRDSIGAIWIGDNSTSSTLGNAFNIRNGGTARLPIGKTVAGVYTGLYTTLTDNVKIAIKWNGSTADIFVNGVKVISATAFTATNMEFLNGQGTDVPKFIQAMALYPTPLSDTDCTTLTTL